MYYAKLRLNKRQYLACTDKALVIVTENENGEPVRWAIFGDVIGSAGKGITQEQFDKSWNEFQNNIKKLEQEV